MLVSDVSQRPAFYAAGTAGWRAWWTLLHPPYTLWHLSYVAIGAALAPVVDVTRLIATLAAFLLAMGVGAHALDELNGRPLRTRIPSRSLIVAAVAGVLAGVLIGVAMLLRVGGDPLFVAAAVVAILAGVAFVGAYSLEWFGGIIHNDAGFAATWGAFPVIVSYCAQAEQLHPAAIVAAGAAFATAYAQRMLSLAARFVRRRTTAVVLTATLLDGRRRHVNGPEVIAPIEVTLRALVWGHVALAVALLAARLL